MYRHEDKPYHIDYCFASKDLCGKILAVEIGDYKAWMPYSDHVPLSVTFNF
jgi:endonuclease/exonuclease/phosphatase family metal-dependent hydrolase